MPPKGTKKNQEATARTEIAKKRQLRDKSKSESPSGSEESYEIDSLGEPPTVTTKSQDKSQVIVEEEPKIRTSALNEVPELRRIFEKYNMHWMAETPKKYISVMVREFYANYYSTLENKAPTRQAVKKEPVLDMVLVRECPVDISERTISRLVPTVNDNILSADWTTLMTCIMSEYVLNIPQIIAVEIRE
ncbi:hypothetical protein HAX54_047385 [Datura stramonium]|uniref:Uncharacterized protein n=1 Tax=Datura stramonium TaxID=4076 RepID=A0ABS8WK14_DATST|nr:hypothetical protein [Datura stramonium]